MQAAPPTRVYVFDKKTPSILLPSSRELKGSAHSDNRKKGEDQLASLIKRVEGELPASCHHEGASERIALLAFGASRTVPNDQLGQAQFRKRTGVKLKYAYDLYEQSPYSLRPHIPSR